MFMPKAWGEEEEGDFLPICLPPNRFNFPFCFFGEGGSFSDDKTWVWSFLCWTWRCRHEFKFASTARENQQVFFFRITGVH